jgi:hypothetical protein
MEYFALIIPILASVLMLTFYKKKITWWELMLPILAGLVLISIFRFTGKKIMVSDTDYRGSLIVEARYYEPWSTWVDRTCTSTCCCDSKGNNCTTTTYDCSYCEDHDAKYEVLDDKGHKWSVSAAKYEELKKRWSSIPTFVELNRSIDKHGSCGVDGDMYYVRWNGQVATSEAATVEVSYTNKIQATKSAFNFTSIDHKTAKKMGLYDYPELFDQYRQTAILGLDTIMKGAQADSIKRLYEFGNGYYGPHKRVKIFVLLYYNKPIDIAFHQEAYWIGGNHNELVVCIGLDKISKEIQWVKPFTWADNKRVIVDTREEIFRSKTFDARLVYGAIARSVESFFAPKSFKDFNYLTVDLPTWATITVWLLVLSLTIGIEYWNVKNEYENE